MNKKKRSNPNDKEFVPYDTSTLSFGLSGSSPVRIGVIRAVEWVTGKITLLKIVNDFEKTGRKYETTFWQKIFDILRINLDCDETDIARIPKTGPVVVVANHPFGFVDGLMLAVLVSRVRPDIKILTRAFFATLPEIDDNMVPVAFPHDEDSTLKNIAVRKKVMDHLADGGAIILFPAGRCATSQTPFGKAIEHEWNPFTAKMILKSKARVIPVFIPGQNGRAFQIVQTFSATLRQSLMMHEIKRGIGKTIRPIIGDVIDRDEIDPWVLKPRKFMDHMRKITLDLENKE